MLRHETGVLAATTAFGKTVIAAWLIARRGVNTLVLVHRQQLLEQWIERLSSFLNVPAASLGRLGGGRRKLTGKLDVALIQSLGRKGVVDDVVANYGHLVVDECHHLSARSFELVARRARAKFVTGLSATVARKDGHHPIIFMQCGPVRHRVDARRQAAEAADGQGRVILATGKYIGEGFDDPRLDTLFLAMPVSWRGTIAQYAGRLHRLHEGKREVRIHDYADLEVAMLARMFDRRCRGYEALGYTILLPASAVPGWPPEVPLPVDPAWKRDYAASVRRLIRDGVDAPLADLFVHVVRSPAAGAPGEDRARNASKAFLFRRLQTLPETAGRFRLNVGLPIPFNDRGAMEVDFLCAESRLVIELDGAQHLAGAAAYRRDRKKDALLQQHGYFVLRFLAEDVGQRLDDVLDAVIAALVHRRQGR